MKIAMVFDAMLYGGIERVGINYIRLLKNMGHEVTVFILNPNEIEGIINDIPSDCKIIKRKFSSLLCPERYWYIAKRWWWGKFVFPLVFVILRAILELYKLTYNYNKYDVSIAFAGHTSDLSFVAYDFIKSNKKIAWLHGGLYSYMIISPGYERLYRKIKNLVVLNELVQNECLLFNKYLIHDIRIKKIYNPSYIREQEIDEKLVLELRKRYGDFILMVARINAPKNHKALIKAVEILKNKYGVNKNLVFVGDGPLRDEIEEYVLSTNVKDNCFFVGTQTAPQNYYVAAKLFVLSSFSEGLPTVLVEAAAFGLPLVSSDTSVKEILGNNEYGLICPIDDPDAMANTIYNMLTDRILYEKYSAASLKRFEDFTPQVIEQQLNDLLENLK